MIDDIARTNFGNPAEWDLVGFHLTTLQAMREEYVTDCDNGPRRETIRWLFRNARLALERPPEAVVEKTKLSPSGNPQDYYHPDPYWWPYSKNKDRLPYVKRDGKRIHGTVLYEPGSGRYDRTRLQRLFDDGISLALTSMLTCEDRYVEHAGAWLRRWFLEPESRMNPHLRYARVRLGHNRNEGLGRGVIETKDIYYYLDAVRIVEKFGVLTASESRDFRHWLAEYLTWLKKSVQGLSECRFPNHHGIHYDLQVASIASFLNDDEELRRTFIRAKERIPEHFSPKGVPYQEMARTQTAHHCCLNLQGWLNLANLAWRYGEDLAHHTAPNGASLQAAINWLSCHFGQPWPYAPEVDFDADRLVPLVHLARALGLTVDVPAEYEGTVTKVTRERPVFHPGEGVRPYWNV